MFQLPKLTIRIAKSELLDFFGGVRRGDNPNYWIADGVFWMMAKSCRENCLRMVSWFQRLALTGPFDNAARWGKNLRNMNLYLSTSVRARLETTMLAAAIALLLAGSAIGQTATFKWSDMLCDYSATYDAKKHSAEQIRDTYKLYEMQGVPLRFSAVVWKYEDIAKLDVAKLDAEYKAKREQLLALKIVNTPYWQKARAAKLKELDQVYELTRVSTIAYTDPAVLRTYNGAESCKLKYAEPIIAGGEDLIKIWREVNVDSQAKNSDPARLQRRWEQENASPDRLKFALVETMSFGWWNCANNFIEYDPADGGVEREKEFKKIFTRVRTLACSEP